MCVCIKTKENIQQLNSRIHQRLNSICEQAERINKLEDRSIDIIQSRNRKEKKMKKNEQSLRSLWGIMICAKTHLLEVTEGE